MQQGIINMQSFLLDEAIEQTLTKSGLIENFFFTSVSGEYLTAALDAM